MASDHYFFLFSDTIWTSFTKTAVLEGCMESRRKHRGGLGGYVLNLREFDHTITDTLKRIEKGQIGDIDRHQSTLHRILLDQTYRAEEFKIWVDKTRYFRRRPIRYLVLWLIVRNIAQKIDYLGVANHAMMDRLSAKH